MIIQRNNEFILPVIALAGIINMIDHFTLLNVVASATLLIFLHAYHDIKADSTTLKRLAFSATWALSSISIIGFLLQLISSGAKSDIVLSLYWLIATAIVFLWTHLYYLENHKNQNLTP